MRCEKLSKTSAALCVFTLQDHIGPDHQKMLWAGLGPEAGEMLSPRTSFLVMPLYTAGSLEVLLIH